MTMKTLLLGTAASVLLAGVADAAHFRGWYVSLEGGANWIEDEDVGNDNIDPFWVPGIYVPTTTSFDTGWAALGSIGYSWGNWRAELELGYRANEIDVFQVVAISYLGGGKFDEFSQMLNIIYDLHLGERWSISLGAGAGGDFIDYENNSGFHTVPIHDDDYVFAWQAIGGVNYAIGQRSVLFVNYRYFNAIDPEFTEIDFLGILHNDTYEDVNKHTVTIGLRFDLSPDVVEAPPPPSEPVAEPPPPPQVQEFVIFFGHNKANLTAEARQVIKEAAAAAKAGGNVRVVGHADKSGSAAHNDKLSLRRANNVKGELVREGVAESAISVEARGESDPAVPTADGVREPQNRRVEIHMDGGGAPPPST